MQRDQFTSCQQSIIMSSTFIMSSLQILQFVYQIINEIMFCQQKWKKRERGTQKERERERSPIGQTARKVGKNFNNFFIPTLTIFCTKKHSEHFILPPVNIQYCQKKSFKFENKIEFGMPNVLLIGKLRIASRTWQQQ